MSSWRATVFYREGGEADADAEAPLPVIAEEVEVAGDRALQQVPEIAAGTAPAHTRREPPTRPFFGTGGG